MARWVENWSIFRFVRFCCRLRLVPIIGKVRPCSMLLIRFVQAGIQGASNCIISTAKALFMPTGKDYTGLPEKASTGRF